MQSYRSIEHIPYRKDSHVTLGTFDGIHRGHRKIISELVHRAKSHDARSVLITFDPHPQDIIRGDGKAIGLLNTLDEKLQLLEILELDALLVLPFNESLRRMEPSRFVEELLVHRVGMQEFILGFNHAFGKQRRGNVELLEELGKRYRFHVDVIPPVEVDGNVVSSTRIRSLLRDGKVNVANRLLGRPYSLEGIVRSGNRLGIELGFPTANIEVKGKDKLVPADGVYAVSVILGDRELVGTANLGFSPTVDGDTHRLEVHIHDFSDDVYDHPLQIRFVDRIRDEEKFDTVEALVKQMEKDKKRSMHIVSRKLRRNTWD